MSKVPDGLVLLYCKDGTLYPVVLSEDQNELLQFVGKLFAPIRYIQDRPLGPAVNLAEEVKGDGSMPPLQRVP